MTEREIIERKIAADVSRLYGPIPEAIAYLNEVYAAHPDAVLYEEWQGYEDMTMCFAYHTPETDEEFEIRQEWEEAEKIEKEQRRQKAKDMATKIRQEQIDAANTEYNATMERLGK